MSQGARAYTLDPVTFEVLKNAFSTTVDEMAEQILRTCHSFVIYNRDFSSALCDSDGNTVAQGSQDLASHVGTLHFTAKAVIDAFRDDMHAGDVFVTNDPYLGGTHFCDVRVIRPIFVANELIAFAESNGHWADVGGKVPGSFDFTAKEHFGEGLRITPVRLFDRGRYLRDVARLIVANTRAPADAEGDLLAQSEATRVAEGEILRLVDKYGKDIVITALAETQDYVERVTRMRIRNLPDGLWKTEDYIDFDPDGEEGLIPIRVKMTIAGDTVHYDLSESHHTIGSLMNAGFGAGFSGVIGGMKLFFPDIPLNSGFYRPIRVVLGKDTIVNAPWPVSVTGFAMPYEKVMNAVIELWSGIVVDRAMACSYNIEYLEVGGRDARMRDRPFFMWYDWVVGGWGGRNGRDGASALSSVFGVGLRSQPLEGQERLCPVLTTEHELLVDSGGPGQYRGGLGVVKGGLLTDAEQTVASYLCDRERSITWGTNGGLPSNPMGMWLERDGDQNYLGAAWSDVPLKAGDRFWRPSAGGGGFGDPLERDVSAVLDDVEQEYVSIERARKDYGVVVRLKNADSNEYEIDFEQTAAERERIRSLRLNWLTEDAESVAARYRAGQLDLLDVVRQYGVILQWGTGELLRRSTEMFREMLARRAVNGW